MTTSQPNRYAGQGPALSLEPYEDAELRASDNWYDPATLATGWDISFGCRINIGPSFDRFEVSVHVSDAAQRDGSARVPTTPAELRTFAAQILAVANRHDDLNRGENGWRDGDQVVTVAADHLSLWHRRGGLWRLDFTDNPTLTDEAIDTWLAAGRIVHVQTPRSDKDTPSVDQRAAS